MEKEIQSDSITTITLKPEYPPSEIYSSEPPPAYHRRENSVVQVTKIIAVSVVILAFILGSFILASAYITANASCNQSEHKLESISADTESLQPLSPKALVQEPIHRDDEPEEESEESDSNAANSDSEYLIETLKQTPVYIKLNFDDLTSLQKNEKNRINCTIDKKQLEESADSHDPIERFLKRKLPRDSNYEKSKDGGIVISCENENIQKSAPSESAQDEENFMLQVEMLPITRLSRQLIPQLRPPMFMEMNEPNPFPQIQVLNHIVQDIISQNLAEDQKPPKPEMKYPPKPEQPEGVIRQKMLLPGNVLFQMNKSPEQNSVTMIAHKYAKFPIERKAPMPVPVQESEITPEEMKFIAPEIDAILADLQSQGGLLQQIREVPQMEKKNVQKINNPPPQIRPNVQEVSDAQQEFTNAVPMRLPLRMAPMGMNRPVEMGVMPFEDLKI